MLGWICAVVALLPQHAPITRVASAPPLIAHHRVPPPACVVAPDLCVVDDIDVEAELARDEAAVDAVTLFDALILGAPVAVPVIAFNTFEMILSQFHVAFEFVAQRNWAPADGGVAIAAALTPARAALSTCPRSARTHPRALCVRSPTARSCPSSPSLLVPSRPSPSRACVRVRSRCAHCSIKSERRLSSHPLARRAADSPLTPQSVHASLASLVDRIDIQRRGVQTRAHTMPHTPPRVSPPPRARRRASPDHAPPDATDQVLQSRSDRVARWHRLR